MATHAATMHQPREDARIRPFQPGAICAVAERTLGAYAESRGEERAHSTWIATSGSTRAARRAGTIAAATPATIMIAAAPAQATTSSGDVP